MSGIVEYKIITFSYASTLMATVNEMLEAGWEPLGGVTRLEYTSDAGVRHSKISQAMIRREKS